jgi:hypothetical protein
MVIVIIIAERMFFIGSKIPVSLVCYD